MLKNKTHKNNAVVKNNHLILSFSGAETPVLWRKDLNDIGSATFEIKQEKTKFFLILKKQKGTPEKISSFEQKEQAIDALNMASQALLEGEKISVASSSTTPRSKSGKKWVIIIIIILALLGLYRFSMSQMPNRVALGNSPINLENNTNQSADTGVPLSADDFLSGL